MKKYRTIEQVTESKTSKIEAYELEFENVGDGSVAYIGSKRLSFGGILKIGPYESPFLFESKIILDGKSELLITGVTD